MTTASSIALLTAAFEASPHGTLVLDACDRIVYVNQQFLSMFRLSPNDVADRPGADVLASLPAEATAPGGAPAPSVYAAQDGVIAERRSIPITRGDAVIGRLETFHDVTRLRQCQRAADDERALRDRVQEIAQIGSWTWQGPLPGLVHGSLEGARIVGIAPDALPIAPEGLLSLVFVEDLAAVRRAAEAAWQSGDLHEVEHRIMQQDRELRWLHVKVRVSRDEQGRAVRMVGTVQDITRRRTLDEQVRQSQKLEAIGRLAGGVAHDLNNALTAIVGYTELAMGGLAADHPAWADVREIRNAAERAEAVTRQLLSFSRQQRLRPRVIQLGQSVQTLGPMLTRLLGGGVEIRITADAELPAIYGDPGQIQQALVNLALNGRDAMDGRGRLEIQIRAVAVDEAFVRAHMPMPLGRYVELAVTDTGAGMSAETQAHIFEPFFTTKPVGKGTGLGLPMVYATVQQSGGFVSVESAEGSGTAMRLYFPAADAPAPVESLLPNS